MTWVVGVVVDRDKTNPGTGTATAIFTDTDGTTLTVTQRATLTGPNANAFEAACVSALTEWRAAKTREINAMSSLVATFNGAGQTGTTAAAPSNWSIDLAGTS